MAKFELPQDKVFASVDEAADYLREHFGPGTLAQSNVLAYFIHTKPPHVPYAPPIFGVRKKRNLIPLLVLWTNAWRPKKASGWEIIKEVT